jgi:hypothetical protein
MKAARKIIAAVLGLSVLMVVPVATAAAPYDTLLGRQVVKGLNASKFEDSPFTTKPVYVRCYGSDREFEAAAAWRFGEDFHGTIAYALPKSKTVYMRGVDCKHARQFVNDIKAGGMPGKWETYAFATLLHEGLHVQGVKDERVTECLSNDSLRWAAMGFGMAKSYANKLARIAWNMSGKHTASSYVTVSGQCRSTLLDKDWTDYLGY